MYNFGELHEEQKGELALIIVEQYYRQRDVMGYSEAFEYACQRVVEEGLVEEKGAASDYVKKKAKSLYDQTIGQALTRIDKKIDRGVSGIAQKGLSKVPGRSGEIVDASKNVTKWVAGVFAGVPNLKSTPKL